MAIDIGRRQFISVVGGAAIAWPLGAKAQKPAMPVIGFLSSQSPDTFAPFPAAFRQGLKEFGFVDGENVTIEYRWAQGHNDQLPGLAADLVRRQVNVIAATGGIASALAAKAATTTIPIVFNSGDDPVQAGLVSSLNRPGGNMTGVSWFSDETGAKRLSMLHQLVPAAAVMAFLVNPSEPELLPNLAATRDAVRALGLTIIVLKATSPTEIEAAFVAMVRQSVGAANVAPGPFFINQRAQIIALAAQHAIPCMYPDPASPPRGPVPARMRRLAIFGWRRASVWAMYPPIEWPRTSTVGRPSAPTKSAARSAMASMVSGVSPLDPDTPALSNKITGRLRAKPSVTAGSQ